MELKLHRYQSANVIINQNSNSLKSYLPLGFLNQPITIILHLDLISSGRYSLSWIFLILDDILLLDVICMPKDSPFPIATMSKMPNISFFRFVKEL